MNKTKRIHLPITLRHELWEAAGRRCQYCGQEVDLKEMQVDHIKPLHNGGGNALDNLRCACRACNYRKGTMDTETFRREVELSVTRLRRDFTFRLAVAYGLVTVNDMPVVFEFEKGDKQ